MIRKIKNIYHLLEAVLANILYGFPSREITVIGVTGTDGKTTTSHIMYHILKSSGKKVSIISSVFSDVAGEINDTGLHVTTQSRWEVQKSLRKAVNKGYAYFVLETTSHGIDQFRVWGIDFQVGVLTNVTREHLDYHKTYDNYLQTKAKLPLMAKVGIINKDDSSYKRVSGILLAQKATFKTYSLKDKADIMWSDRIETNLKEEFNKQNILAAYGACLVLGISEKDILKAISTFRLPKGRFDMVYEDDFSVMVDFAHTPHSIRTLFKALKDHGHKRVIHVFGSAGLRDYKKRPDMGKASAESADITIITEEDYRTEKFEDIAKAVAKGLDSIGFKRVEAESIKNSNEYTIIENRQAAINRAVSIAKKGDIVVVTGKGHEKSLARGKKEYDWDEYAAVKKALELRK